MFKFEVTSTRGKKSSKVELIGKRKAAYFEIIDWACSWRDKKRKQLKKEAQERAQKHLDIVKFIRSQMKVSIMFNTIFTSRERYLIRNQRDPFVLSEKVKTHSELE